MAGRAIAAETSSACLLAPWDDGYGSERTTFQCLRYGAFLKERSTVERLGQMFYTTVT